MSKPVVSLIDFVETENSVQRAVEMCGGLDHLPRGTTVFVKPNVVFWTRKTPFPKYGVITTSRVVEGVVALLKDAGAGRIIIGEGMVTLKPGDKKTPAHAFENLGYNRLSEKYGCEVVNIMERPFERVEVADGTDLKFNRDFLESDFVVNLPVLKTHVQAVVSLGIKNLKGLIDIPSRKKCHEYRDGYDLHDMISLLPGKLPPSLTLIDGIFSNERGPGFDGTMRRMDLLIASRDIVAADMTGAAVLGYEPGQVPHLVKYAEANGLDLDPDRIEVLGRTVGECAKPHHYAFDYNDDGTLPLPMEQMGLSGFSCPKYDLSLCTYCSLIFGVTLALVAQAWQGRPFDRIELLSGKVRQPTPGMNKTILLGQCICRANRNHPDINEALEVPGCPPKPDKIVQALHQAGIEIDPAPILNLEYAPGAFLKKYQKRPEFDESLFRVE